MPLAPLLGVRLLLASSALLGLGLLIWLAHGFYGFTVDDTFITLRYAKHLGAGLGPTWNPGGPRVEGYTSALWMLLLAPPHLLGLDALTFAKVLGVALTYGSIAVAALCVLELGHALDGRARALGALVPFAFLGGYWPLSLHAISGMETGLACLTLTVCGFVSIRHLRQPSARRARTLALLALLSTLTRPEAGLACGVLLCTQLALTRSGERRALVRAALAFCVLPGALYFVARYAYFGLLFPLPFYVKATGQERFAGLDELLTFLAPFAWPRPWLALLVLAGSVRARGVAPTLAGLGSFALFFVFPAHIMGFESRYLMPIVPLLTALMGFGLARLLSPLLSRAQRAPLRYALSLGTAALLWLSLALVRFPPHEDDARTRWLAYGSGLRRAHVGLARDLRSLGERHGGRKIALLDVGAVAYYSDWFTIDTYGLNDRRVALSRRTDIDYVFSHRPEVVVVVSAVADAYTPVFDWEQPLYERAVAAGYRRWKSYEFLPDYHLLALTKEPSP